jgi:hypothetical protein
MSFVLAPVEAIRVIVNIEIPGDYGNSTPADLDIKFKKLPVSELKKIQDGEKSKIPLRDIVRDNILDIQGVKGVDGKDIHYSDEVRDQLMDMSHVLGAVLMGFWQAQNGQKKEEEKNS